MKRLLIFTCLFDIDADVVFDRRFVFSKASDVTHPEKRPGQRCITHHGYWGCTQPLNRCFVI